MAAKTFAHTVITSVTIFAVNGAMAADNNSKQVAQPWKATVTNYKRPLSFEPNRGQTQKRVDFLARGTGYTLFLSHAEAVIVLERGSEPKQGPQRSVDRRAPTAVMKTAVRMRPAGANASAIAEPLEEFPAKSNYFVGSDPAKWHTGIPTYAKVQYRNIYPGVDLLYYGNQTQLEYDFIVKPGANARNIALQFQGADHATLDRSGDLVMHTPVGDTRWHKPVAYQEVNGTRKLIRCDYVRGQDHRVAFKLGSYDRAKSLVIDPVLVYSTYLGGNSGATANAIAVDIRGNAYVAGGASSGFPATVGAFQSSGPAGIFVTKFDFTGAIAYSAYLGGSGTVPDLGDQVSGIAVDDQGAAYITGQTGSPDFPTTMAFQSQLHTFVPPNTGTCGSAKGCVLGYNAFVTKLKGDASGFLYSTFLGGSAGNGGGDEGAGVAVDINHFAYVTGTTSSPDFPTTSNAFQRALNGNTNAFVAKFAPAGDIVYSTYLGGSTSDNPFGIAVDGSGNAYIAGSTNSSDFPTKNAFQDQLGSLDFPGDAFVTKLNAAGTDLVYSTYLGGSNMDEAWGITVDRVGNAYVAGWTMSTDFPTQKPFQPQLKAFPWPGNGFVTKFSADGTALVYSTYLGGSGNPVTGLGGDAGTAIAVNQNGEAYVTGWTTSSDFPINNAFQDQNNIKTSPGTDGSAPGCGGEICSNAFVTKFSADGTSLVYSSYLGGSGWYGEDDGDVGSGIAVDIWDNSYVVGRTFSPDFPVTNNASQSTIGGPAGNHNAFVTKISPTAAPKS